MKKGKYVHIDPKNIDAVGVCDYSGFYFNKSDLVKQMEWQGNSLVWTGALVGKPFVDEPSEQRRPPITGSDPTPVTDPRLPNDTKITWGTALNKTWGQLKSYTWGEWATLLNSSYKLTINENIANLQGEG